MRAPHRSPWSTVRSRPADRQRWPERLARRWLGPAHDLVQNRRARGVRQWRPESLLRTAEHRPDRSAVSCVDAHNHLGRWLSPDGKWVIGDVDQLIDIMDSCGIAAIINLDGRSGKELDANIERYDSAFPGRFATFCHLDWQELGRPGFAERLAAGVVRAANQGAKGVKIWKDLGLSRRDHRGRLLQPDSPELEPVWAAVSARGLPVLIHVADPPALFQPVDRFNERLEELLAGGASHGGGFGRHRDLLDSFERLVARHQAVTFIAAHMGCNAEDLTWVERMIGTYPNLSVDMSASLAALGRQPRAARRLLIAHPDRVLFGTDRFPPDAPTYRNWFRFLETDDEAFPHSPFGSYLHGRWTISGLHLPLEVLEAVYSSNARRLVPALGGRAPSLLATEKAK